MLTTLNSLDVGQDGRVCGINTDGGIRRRLLDMGLIEGTRVSCLFKSLAGDPAAYHIRGAVIALREDDSAFIDIET